jgi:hypothetical protein
VRPLSSFREETLPKRSPAEAGRLFGDEIRLAPNFLAYGVAERIADAAALTDRPPLMFDHDLAVALRRTRTDCPADAGANGSANRPANGKAYTCTDGCSRCRIPSRIGISTGKGRQGGKGGHRAHGQKQFSHLSSPLVR